MIPALSEMEFDLFRALIKKNTGITLKPARRQMFGRKLARRLEALGLGSYTAYYRLLKTEQGADELRALINQVTIGQTSFFRGDAQFELLARQMVPELFRRNASSRRMRLWSAGCSRGHEPYSLVMMLQEAVRETLTWDVKVLATDIDSDSLKSAYRGRYRAEELAHIPEDYIARYFRSDRKSGGRQLIVRDRLKKHVRFRRLNLLEFPYPLTGPMDIIFCRNVMIYFSKASKQRIMAEFLRLLPEGGYLCLGASESLLGIDDRFALIGHAVYRKRNK